MSGKIVNKLLDKVPFSNEIRDAVKDTIDLRFTKQLAGEIIDQLFMQGDKIKKDFSHLIAKEIQREISKTDKKELLKQTLEEMEITISFKRKV